MIATQSAISAGVVQALENAFFLPVGGDQLYCVLHEAAGPRRGMLVVAGTFGGERERAYLTGVHWARRAAKHGFDVLRFDYRGIGESTGRFEEMTCSHWREDITACVKYLRERDAHAPIVMQGLRLGAVLMSEMFATGMGDAMLLWSTVTGARAHLWEYLRRVLGTDLVMDPDAPRKTREEYLADLEAGGLINIDGYFWSAALWGDSTKHTLKVPPAGSPRPWRIFEVRPPGVPAPAATAGATPGAALPATSATDASPAVAPAPAAKAPANRQVIVAARFFESIGRVAPDTELLYAASVDWLESSVAGRGDAAHAKEDSR